MTEGYCCQTIEINVPNTSPLNFSFKSLMTVLVLLFLFLNKTPFPPWSSSENSKYHRGTKPKAGMDDFFTIPLKIVFQIQMSGLLLLSRNTVKPNNSYEPNNFAIAKYKMAKSYSQILTSETWRAETVLLWKLPRCSWMCLQQSQWKVFFVWIGMKTKHYDFYSSKSSCKIKTETEYFWYKACQGSQVFGRTHEEHNGEKIQIPTNSRQWAEPLFSIWNLNVIIRSYYICSSYHMSVLIWVQSTD